jgi:hypothetical protein
MRTRVVVAKAERVERVDPTSLEGRGLSSLSKMNTAEKYKTPNIRHEGSGYESDTWFKVKGYCYISVRLHVTWFNMMGWYFGVRLEGWTGKKGNPGKFFHEMGRCDDLLAYRNGKDRNACAVDCEAKAVEMLRARGVRDPKFLPFKYTVTY